MRKIYLIQHTQSLHHVKGVGRGWYDTSLTELGLNQARLLAKNLFDKIGGEGTKIFCSDLKRTIEVAEVVNQKFNGSISKDPRLREMCFGDAEGQNKEWQSSNIQLPHKINNRINHRVFETAETRAEISNRVKEFISEIEKLKDPEIIIIIHGFALSFFILNWLKIPIVNMDYASFKSSPGGVTLLAEDDKYFNRELIYLNNLEFINK